MSYYGTEDGEEDTSDVSNYKCFPTSWSPRLRHYEGKNADFFVL